MLEKARGDALRLFCSGDSWGNDGRSRTVRFPWRKLLVSNPGIFGPPARNEKPRVGFHRAGPAPWRLYIRARPGIGNVITGACVKPMAQ